MTKKAITVVFVWLAFVAFAHAGSGPDLEEGLWQITVELDMPGMSMKMPASTFTQCMRKNQPVPHDAKPGQQCKTKNVTTKGNTVSWTMVCTQPGGQMTSKGTVSYHHDKMVGSMTMTMPGQGMTMTSRFKGHRVGECR
jgi:hypothetical protein